MTTKAEEDFIFWSLLLEDIKQHKPMKRLGALERNYKIDEDDFNQGGDYDYD